MGGQSNETSSQSFLLQGGVQKALHHQKGHFNILVTFCFFL